MRYLNLLLVLPAFSLLSSCSEDTAEQESTGRTTIVACADSYAKSGRTSFEEGADGKMLGVYWSPNDQIGVFSATGNENAPFTTDIKQKEPYAAFTGQFSGTPAFAYYPYSVANADANALAGVLPAEQNYDTAEGKLHYDYKYGVPHKTDARQFSFTHFFPMIRFVVDAKGSTMAGEKLVSVTLTLPQTVQFHVGDFTADVTKGTVNWVTGATSNELKMVWAGQPVMSADKIVYGYLFMDAVSGLRNQTLKVTLTTDQQTKVFSSPLVIDQFKPNYIYNVPLTLTGWEDQFVDPNPGEGGLHIDHGEADNSEILSVKPVYN